MGAFILAALVGLAVGSFLNVVITRLPRGEPVWAGRSQCLHCRTPLPWHDNLPLFSYFWLKGQCRFCQGPIPWRYPAVELAAGALALALWAVFPKSPMLLAYVPFTSALVALTAIDLEHHLLPDAITLPGIVLGLALALVLRQPPFLEALLGAGVGAALFQGLAWAYHRWARRPGMGGGDVKLMALIGAFLGIKALPLVILVSAALGSLVGLVWALRSSQGRHTPIPYGPFLAVGALLYLLGAGGVF